MHPPRRIAIALALCVAFAACAAHAQGTVQVNGTGNVGVATNLGTINLIGPTRADIDAAQKANGAEQARLLRQIGKKLDAALAQGTAAPPKDEFSATIVQGFLATVVGKNVPQSEWPAAFNELAHRFFELRDQIAATPVTSPEIGQLMARAEAARQAGDLAQVDTLLEAAEKQVDADVAQRKAQLLPSSRQVASLRLSRASNALAQLDHEKAAQLLEEAFDERAADVAPETVDWLVKAAHQWTTLGKSGQSLRVLERACSTATSQADKEPANVAWKQALYVCRCEIGDRQRVQGNLSDALQSYQACRDVAGKQAASAPGDSHWQRELAISQGAVGSV